MSQMIEVRTSDLVGAALDWATGRAARGQCGEVCNDNGSLKVYLGQGAFWTPSTDWSQGGPLIEKYSVTLERNAAGFCDAEQPWYAEVHDDWATGSGPLVAACRVLVGFKLGDTVQVPAELVTA